MKTPKMPDDLGGAGRKLWRELTRQYAFNGSEPALAELCRVGERLTQVRAALARDGLVTSDGKQRHPLADLEPKLSGQFRMLWRMLHLSDDPEPPKKEKIRYGTTEPD